MADFPNKPKVAVLVSTANGWGRNIIKGILSYASEVAPWQLSLRSSELESFYSIPKDWNGDGIIGRISDPALAEEIKRTGLPVVDVSDTSLSGFSSPCFRTDDLAGTKMAIDHFKERGLKNFAIVGPLDKPNPQWYTEAYRSHLATLGHTCETFTLEDIDKDQSAKFIDWLQKLPKPVGILTWGHNFAMKTVSTCMDIGISVPHDIAVLSGDYDELLSNACFPALAGIMLPTEQIGYRAAQTLHRILEGEPIEDSITYIPPLGIQPGPSTDMLATDDPRMVEVVTFIREHAFAQITMKDIIKKVPMARRSLERRFQLAFGHSPSDEIRRIRMVHARELLVKTTLPMQQIAEACGYATYNHLTTVFKKHVGCTPRDYRKRYRK
ncbi:helix-turn-helix domain-containing protein [Luteolibacter algae]|uniref:Helix-turn-helix domain-containing protein n=1 Tax=Luteolibacter algae TaxID=454151 RepID=A0ABW5DAV3_9BACT